MVDFSFKPIRFNYSSRKGQKIRYLVIHDTGNSGRGANAMAHFKYFNGANRNASAHYFVDDKHIVQIIGDSFSAWHCGDNQGHGRALNGVRNCSSIGIELCVNSDGDYARAFDNLVELTKNLMVKFNIPHSNVCRHYDVSRKSCPNSMRKFNWDRWGAFKEAIKEPIKVRFDLSKDSVGKLVQQKDLDKRIEFVKGEMLKMDKVKVEINGKKKELRGKNISGTNYVAIRDVAEMLGFRVAWDQDKQEVILKG